MSVDFKTIMSAGPPEEQVDLVMRLVSNSRISAQDGRDALVTLMKGAEARGWNRGVAYGVDLAAEHAEKEGKPVIAASIRSMHAELAAKAASTPDDADDATPQP